MSVFSLDGMRVAITGARGGIGASVAQLCVEQGANTLFLADLEAPSELANKLGGGSATIVTHAVNMTERDSVEAWASELGAVDALIDCAAICPFYDWVASDWDAECDRVFAVNLRGPINLVRAFMPMMTAQGGGRIALVGSIAGRIGGVAASAHYVMSKGGVHSFVRWAAKRGAAHNVTVNAVAPGVVDTPMTANQSFDYEQLPMGRKATALEIAGPLAFLISPAASYVNGAVLDVNSGMHFS